MAERKFEPHVEKGVRDYLEHMPEGNDLILIVLKGHLLIEQLLEQIIQTVVAHGAVLANHRFQFSQKVPLARSMAWSQRDNKLWDFIVALNTYRNDVAHSLGSEKSEARLKKVMEAHEATLTAEELNEVSGQSDADRLRHAIMLTMGFLGKFLEDAKAYRSIIDATLAAKKASTAKAGESKKT